MQKVINELHQAFYLIFQEKDYYKRGCLRLSVLSKREGQKEESPGNISINPRLSLNSDKLRLASYSSECKE